MTTQTTAFRDQISALAVMARVNAEPDFAEMLDAIREGMDWQSYDADRTREAALTVADMASKVVAVFEQAADYMDERGWAAE